MRRCQSILTWVALICQRNWIDGGAYFCYHRAITKGVAHLDIGCKIKQARLQAGLTQEQAAAALGVSRQTISNWETEKTYPDIISVVKMSDLYAVSLDQLLKGEAPADGYLDYLAESTDAVQSRRKLSLLLLTLSYLGIWTFSLIVFWFFTSGSDAMGYSIMFLWVLLPVVTLIFSLLIGKNDFGGRWKWLVCIAFGIMYMLAEYATFSTANMVAFSKLNLPHFSMIPTGAVVSLIGLGIGSGLRRLAARRK